MAKDGSRIHCTSPPGVRQDLAKTRVVGSIIQQTFHPVHLRVHLVAALGEHGQTGARIDVIRPIALGFDLGTNLFSKFQELQTKITPIMYTGRNKRNNCWVSIRIVEFAEIKGSFRYDT